MPTTRARAWRRARRRQGQATTASAASEEGVQGAGRRTILAHSKRHRDVQQVRLAERVLRVARIELDDALERVERPDVERERLLEHEERQALRARRRRQAAAQRQGRYTTSAHRPLNSLRAAVVAFKRQNHT